MVIDTQKRNVVQGKTIVDQDILIVELEKQLAATNSQIKAHQKRCQAIGKRLFCLFCKYKNECGILGIF